MSAIRLRLSWLWSCLLVACSDDITSRTDAVVDAGELCTHCGACEEIISVNTATHVTGTVDYPSQPPVGGDHSQCWANWGVQDSELKPERWVHNLEHGGVALLYRCENDCDEDIARLSTFTNDHPRTLLTAYSKLPQRFAIVSWEHRLVSDCLDLDAFELFYKANFDHGLESIDSGPSLVCQQRPEI